MSDMTANDSQSIGQVVLYC